jgi:hypothetical protein
MGLENWLRSALMTRAVKSKRAKMPSRLELELLEDRIVPQAQPTLTTLPNPTAVLLPTSTVLADSATLANGINETGTITFTLTSPSGAVVYTDPVPVNGNGTYNTSAGSANNTNLVQNGGFETGNLSGWTFSPASSGSDFEVDGIIAPHTGSYAADFGAVSTFPDSISQTLTTVPGQTYNLSYWLNHNESDSENDFQVSWGGTVLQNLSNTSTFGWTNYTFAVTAASSTTVLTFSGYEVPAWYALDDVSVIASGYTPTQLGTYQWNASYGGDANNLPVSDNNDPAEQVTAQPSPPSFTADTPPSAVVGDAYSYQFQASGWQPITFSATNLPAWAQLDSSTGVLSGTPIAAGTYDFVVTASNGALPNATANVSLLAQYEPPTFTADTPPAASSGTPYSYQFQATGTGTQAITYTATGLPGWAVLNPTTGVFSGTPSQNGTFNFSVTADNGISPATTVNVTMFVGPQYSNTFNVPANTNLTIPSGIYAGGTFINVGAGATATIDAGTFTGGMAFDVAAGGVVDIIGSPSVAGVLTGSGSGTVQVFDGRLFIGTGGATLEFSGKMFQWTGGQMDLGNGDLTNYGTMTITAPVDFYNDGVLFNHGTIIQSGSGNLQLGTDGLFPSTLDNEATGSYLLEGDGGLTEISDSGNANGQTSLINAGIIQKTAGTGSSPLDVLGAITNTGTIEADSGTIAISAVLGLDQVSGNTLTAGTWITTKGAALDFPSGTTITDNAANLTLSGTGATISGISGLATSSGNMTITDGADFSTTGNLTIDGNLTLGPGSTLTVNGDLSLGNAATLTDQIGGTPGSGQFGEASITGAADLAGAFTLNLVNGFTAAAGDDYQVLSFASTSGNFASVSGLGSTFSQTLSSNSLVIAAFANPVDLDVAIVTAPASAVDGQSITVNWQVNNDTSQSSTLSWLDDVYLSTSSTIAANSILLGSVLHTGGITANGSYQASLTINLPALAPANYYVLVETDGLYQVPDPDRTNNTLAATTGQLDVTVPTLTLGTPYPDSFTANDQNHYYQISAAAGTSLLLAVSGSPATQMNAIYDRFDSLPTTYQSDFQSSMSADPTLAIPAVQAGTYYIIVHNQSGALGSFDITASVATLTLLQASPNTAGNSGPTTLSVAGLNLQPNTSYSLIGPGGTVPATAATNVNSAQAYVTFNLTGTTPGSYNLQATNSDNTTSTLDGAVQVVGSGGPHIVATLIGESPVRVGRESVFYVQYTNTGNEDGSAPLLTLTSATHNLMGMDPNQAPSAMNLQILGISQIGAAGVLRPGQQFQIPVYFIPTQSGAFSFTVSLDTVTDTSDSLNQVFWNAIKAEVPASITAAADWPAVYAQLQQEIGTSWGSYISMLDHYTTLLPPGAGNASSPEAPLQIAANQAVAAVSTSISGTTTATGPGVALAGNTITATNSTTGDVFTSTILNDGSFVFPTVTPGSYTFSVANALIDGSPPPLTVLFGQALIGVSVTLDPEVVLTGQVTSAATGAPLPGASVCVMSGSGTNFVIVASINTDSNGDYSLAFVPGAYTLIVEGVSGVARMDSAVTLAAGPTRLDFALIAESAVTGVVSLSDGNTVQSVSVLATLEGNEPDPYFSDVFTTANFTLGSLMAGTYDILISTPGYSVATINAVTIGQGQTVNLGAIELTPVDPFWLTPVKAADYAALGALFSQFGSDAKTIYHEYFNGSSSSFVPGTLSVANAPVTISDSQDVNSFKNSPTTANALQATLQQIEDNITSLPEVQDAINSFQNCDDDPYEDTFDVEELMSDTGLSAWQTVTNASSSDATSVWKYAGLGNLPGVIAGGVGVGGPPPPFAVFSLDNRVVTGTVDLTITPDGTATITANFTVSVHDTFDFDPGDLGSAFVQVGTRQLKLLEDNSYTADVPFDVNFTADPITDTFSVDTSVSDDCDQPNPPQQQNTNNGNAQNSNDPNAISGPIGHGTQNFIPASGTLPYTVDFQNDGSAAAQVVTVTQQLDPNLNWSTFQFGGVGFGNVNVAVPAGLTQYQTIVGYQNTDGTALNVDVNLNFNVATGLMTATFTSIDPSTGAAPNGVFDGFLYPESSSVSGSEGYIQYTVQPDTALSTGTTITQQASVVFDTNAALVTAPPAVNTIDNGSELTSSVNPLPAQSPQDFTVSWAGQDPGGSGIASFNVYVTVNGAAFTLWQSQTTALSAIYDGTVGDTYGFYSVATDNVGNVQPTPTMAQASTLVLVSQTISFGPLSNQTYGNAPFQVSASASSGLPVSFSIVAGGQYASISGNTITILGATSAGTVVTVAAEQAGNGTYLAAPPVDQSFTIAKATPIITWNNPSAIAYFTPLGSNQLDAAANVPGANGSGFVYTPPVGTLLAAGTQTLSATFTPADRNDYSTATATVQLVVLGPGVTVIGTQLYLVGGKTSNDQVQVNPAGSSNTGSTGVKVNATLNAVNTQTTYSQIFTTIDIFLQGGNDNIQLANSLTINTVVTAGNGNDNVQLGNGNNNVTLGNGNDNIQAGSGSNTVLAGNGNDNVQLGNGSYDSVTLGAGNDNVQIGNGSYEVVVLGNGNDNVQLGNGSYDNVTLGTGNDNVQVGNGSNNTVTLPGIGNGHDNVRFGTGSNNKIRQGNGGGGGA